MLDFLFQRKSPLLGWFILMEIFTAGSIGGYWYELMRYGIRPWDHVSIGVAVTILFIVSNTLLFRHRGWAVLGFAACWLLFVLLATA